MKIEKFIFKTDDICEFFGISRKTLSVWERKGAPKEGRGEWDLKKLTAWKYENTGQSAEARKISAEADLKEAKAAQEKIKLCLTEERYMDTREVSAHLKRLFTAIKQSLISIGHKAGGELNSIDTESAIEAKKIINQEIQIALEELAMGADIHVGKSKK